MPLPTVPGPWSFYRLGPTKEKELFKRRRDTYAGVVFPAHIASYYHKFSSEFVGSLGKPYFIDPMTYIFANDPAHLKRFVKDKDTGRTKRDHAGRKKKGDVKRSYSKLIYEEYQGVIQTVVDAGRPLAPNDLSAGTLLADFVKSVVTFQTTKLAEIPEKYRKYAKYAERAGKPINADGNPPMCVVAPYFPTTTLHSRGWHATNLRLIAETKKQVSGLPVFAVVLAEPQVLSCGIKQIATDYTNAGADGFLLWPDGFSSDQDVAALKIVFSAVRTLSSGGRTTILMYGDAFALALHFAGLAGFSCGICYGEKKGSTQDTDVEGAIPPRYYIGRLKKKVVIETEARRIPIAEYDDLVCECEICCRKPDPASLNDTESREHFMLVRADELAKLRGGLSQADFAKSLRDAFDQHADNPLLQPIGHLRNWAYLLNADRGERIIE